MAGRVILVGLCLLAGNLHGCASAGPDVDPPASYPVGYDCSGDQPTDPCVIVPEPTFP